MGAKAFGRPFGKAFGKPFGYGQSLALPKPDQIFDFYKGIDKTGAEDREVFLAQSGLFSLSDYLTGDIATGTTVISSEGGGVIALTEDRLDYTDDESLWSFELSNGSKYGHPTKLSDSSVVWYDTSGNGRTLTAHITSAATHCRESVSEGDDSRNLVGYNQGRWSELDQAYLDEPTRTNKCTCVKANPVSTTGLILTDGVLTVVDDTDDIIDAGLDVICNGNVYKFYNDTEANQAVYTDALVGNTNPHSASVYIRSDKDAYLYINSGDSGDPIVSVGYIKVSRENITPTAATRGWYVAIIPGTTAYFILPQLEEGEAVTSPIIGDDTAAAQTEYNQIVPASNDLVLDALGRPLEHKGRAKYPLISVGVTCGTFDGTATDYLSVAELVGTEKALAWNGTVETITITAGRIDFSAGTCNNLTLDNGMVFPFIEGEGSTIRGYNGVNSVDGVIVHAASEEVFWGGSIDEVPSHDYLHGWSERENLLLWSEDFNSGSWPNAVSGVTKTLSTILAPDGSMSAWKVSSPTSTGVTNSLSLLPDNTTQSIWARTVSGTGKAQIMNRYNDTGALFDLTEEWQRFETNNDNDPIGGGNFYLVDFRATGMDLTDFLVWHPQSGSSEYVKTTDTIVVGRQPSNPNTPRYDVLGNLLTHEAGDLLANQWKSQSALESWTADQEGNSTTPLNTLFNDETPNTLTLPTDIPEDNLQLYAGTKEVVLYSEPQDIETDAKIIKRIK